MITVQLVAETPHILEKFIYKHTHPRAAPRHLSTTCSCISALFRTLPELKSCIPTIMISQLTALVSLMSFATAQFCPPGCQQNFNGNCGGCGIRAYRLAPPPPPPPMIMMAPAPILRPIYAPCGGSPCGPPPMQIMQPCGSGGCGNNGQQIAYGVPDPIITESGRIIRAPFLPPPALPPQGTQQTNYSPIGK